MAVPPHDDAPPRQRSYRWRSRRRPGHGSSRRFIYDPRNWKLSTAPSAGAIPEVIARVGLGEGVTIQPREFSLTPYLPASIDELPEEGFALPQKSIMTVLVPIINQAFAISFYVALMVPLSLVVGWWFGVLVIGYVILMILIAQLRTSQNVRTRIRIISGLSDSSLAWTAWQSIRWLIPLAPILTLLVYLAVNLFNLFLIAMIITGFIVIGVELIRHERQATRSSRLIPLAVAAASVGAFYGGGKINQALPVGLWFMVTVLAIGALIVHLTRPDPIATRMPLRLGHKLWTSLGTYIKWPLRIGGTAGFIVGGGLLYLALRDGRPSNMKARLLLFVALLLVMLIHQIYRGFENWSAHIRWWHEIFLFLPTGYEIRQLRDGSWTDLEVTAKGANDFSNVTWENGLGEDGKSANWLTKLIDRLPGVAYYADQGSLRLAPKKAKHQPAQEIFTADGHVIVLPVPQEQPDDDSDSELTFDDVAPLSKVGNFFKYYLLREEELNRRTSRSSANTAASLDALVSKFDRFFSLVESGHISLNPNQTPANASGSNGQDSDTAHELTRSDPNADTIRIVMPPPDVS